MIGLTPSARELHLYLIRYIRENGQAPTFREMGRALRYAESNLTQPIARHLDQLEQRGYIRRLPYRARAIEMLPPPVIINGEPYRWIPKTRAA